MIKSVSWTKSNKIGSVAKDNHHFIDVALVVKDYYSRTFTSSGDNNRIVVVQSLKCVMVFTSSTRFPAGNRSSHTSMGKIIKTGF